VHKVDRGVGRGADARTSALITAPIGRTVKSITQFLVGMAMATTESEPIRAPSLRSGVDTHANHTPAGPATPVVPVALTVDDGADSAVARAYVDLAAAGTATPADVSRPLST
jgi:hypothetical protein